MASNVWNVDTQLLQVKYSPATNWGRHHRRAEVLESSESQTRGRSGQTHKRRDAKYVMEETILSEAEYDEAKALLSKWKGKVRGRSLMLNETRYATGCRSCTAELKIVVVPRGDIPAGARVVEERPSGMVRVELPRDPCTVSCTANRLAKDIAQAKAEFLEFNSRTDHVKIYWKSRPGVMRITTDLHAQIEDLKVEVVARIQECTTAVHALRHTIERNKWEKLDGVRSLVHRALRRVKECEHIAANSAARDQIKVIAEFVKGKLDWVHNIANQEVATIEVVAAELRKAAPKSVIDLDAGVVATSGVEALHQAERLRDSVMRFIKTHQSYADALGDADKGQLAKAFEARLKKAKTEFGELLTKATREVDSQMLEQIQADAVRFADRRIKELRAPSVVENAPVSAAAASLT